MAARLEKDPILWLGTVSGRGRPHTVPVWFFWADPQVTVFSQPGTAKLGHLQARPGVSIALDSADQGADIVLGEGEAALLSLHDVRETVPGFEAKYRPLLGGQSLAEWLETFSQPIVVTVERLVAWTRLAAGLDYRSLPHR